MTHAELFAEANAAGKIAAEACTPQMIRVAGYPASFPICGFAWVNVRPGNSAFANWLKKEGLARKSYCGGVDIWIGAYNQSYDMKYAHAKAMAAVLAAAGIISYASGRLD